MNDTKWSEHVILVDAEYVDKVAFDMIVNFERMLERRIPQADMAQWLECVALDGGLRPIDRGEKLEVSGERNVQVVLIHEKNRQQMDNFLPGKFNDLDGKAFAGPLGEFLISCVKVEEMVTKDMQPMDSGNFRQEILGYSLMAALGIKSEELNKVS